MVLDNVLELIPGADQDRDGKPECRLDLRFNDLPEFCDIFFFTVEDYNTALYISLDVTKPQ